MNKILHSLRIGFSALFPRYCPICNQQILSSNFTFAICASCLSSCTPITDYCQQCGNKRATYSATNCCISCETNAPHTHQQRIIIGYQYENVIQKLIVQYKFHQKAYLSETLANLLIPVLTQTPSILDNISLIIPMPIERFRLAKRGFNHTLLIAKEISKQLSIPYNHHFLHKRILSKPQNQLNRIQRLKNLNNAFYTTASLNNNHILLIDDVFTTGQTCDRATNALLEAGAHSVTSAIIAKA